MNAQQQIQIYESQQYNSKGGFRSLGYLTWSELCFVHPLFILASGSQLGVREFRGVHDEKSQFRFGWGCRPGRFKLSLWYNLNWSISLFTFKNNSDFSFSFVFVLVRNSKQDISPLNVIEMSIWKQFYRFKNYFYPIWKKLVLSQNEFCQSLALKKDLFTWSH
jgi:hypothetical protein